MMARKVHSLTKTKSNDGTKSSLFDRQKKQMIARQVHPLTKQNKQKKHDGTKSSCIDKNKVMMARKFTI